MKWFRFIISGLLVGFLVTNDGANIAGRVILVDRRTGIVNKSAYNVSSVMFALLAMMVVGMMFTVSTYYNRILLLKQEVASGVHG